MEITESTVEQPLIQEVPVENPVDPTCTTIIGESIARNSSVSINLIEGAEPADGNATNFGTIINIANNIFGVGLLTLPYAFNKFSLVPGYVIIALMCSLSVYSFVLLAKTCNITRQYNYRDMATMLFGKVMGYVVQGIMLCYTYGSCIAHFVVVGDNFMGAFKSFFPDVEWLQNRAIVVSALALFCIFPISLCKTLEGLKFTSFLAVFCVILCTAVAIVEECLYGKINETVEVLNINSDCVLALPLMCVAFASHYNAPRYYMELKNRSVKHFSWILAVAFGIVLLTYYAIGTAGYFQFGVDTKGNILLNYSSTSIYATIARLGMGINMVFSTPLPFFSVRGSIHSIFFPHKDASSFLYRFISSVLVIGSTVFLSIVVNKIETVVGLNGSLFGGLIIFFFPGLLYLEAKNAIDKTPIYRSFNKIMAIICMVIGICVCIGGTYIKIDALITDH
ncbi:hypothetical protein WA158_001084 [Blastocystis sp. Blastoise]